MDGFRTDFPNAFLKVIRRLKVFQSAFDSDLKRAYPFKRRHFKQGLSCADDPFICLVVRLICLSFLSTNSAFGGLRVLFGFSNTSTELRYFFIRLIIYSYILASVL